jgi:hypothetical protein
MDALDMFHLQLLKRSDPDAYADEMLARARRRVQKDRQERFVIDQTSLVAIYPDQELLAGMAFLLMWVRIQIGKILHDRLQPNFAKYGRIDLGSCDFKMFHWWFGYMHEKVNISERNYILTIDGLPVNRKVIKYKWTEELPNLCLDYPYYHRKHGDCSGQADEEIESFYTELSFYIDVRSGRISGKYKQLSVVSATGMVVP